MLSRLPHRYDTRRRIGAALRGHPVSEETRAKIAASLRGRKRSPETIAKITAARRARPARQTDAEKEAATYRRSLDRAIDATRWRWYQRKVDMQDAQRLGNKELMRDVAKSWGWWVKRKMHDPRISDGFSKKFNQVMFVPYLRRLRGPDWKAPKRKW